jgi:aryl-alcohol dehydrogenase-like predicted oxidoreductase
MESRKIGTSELHASVIGLGCNNFGWRIDLAQTRKVIDKAIDLGIKFFDTADIYGDKGGSEEQLGQVLGERRKQIILATKFGMEMESPEKKGAKRGYILSSIEGSLRRLRTDYIDLYQIHQPDPKTPIEETLRTLDELVKQGKVRYIGCSNFSAAQLEEAENTSKQLGLSSFVSLQNEYSLLVRDPEREVLPLVERYGMGFLPFFPLNSGFLTGKYRRDGAMPEGARLTTTQRLSDRYMNEENWTKVEQLRKFAESEGHTLLELAFAWLLSRRVVSSVIAGATKPEQLEQNVRAANWKLTPEELSQVDQITGEAVHAKS